MPNEQQWPIADRTKLQLYSMNTPNGIKVAVALEELGVPYEPHLINILKGDQHSASFTAINLNQKIPAIVEPTGPGLKPFSLAESGAILIYLAEKAGRLIPTDAVGRLHCYQWLFFQVGHIGPMFGQFGHFFKYARAQCKDPYPLERYTKESQRLLSVLDRQLSDSEYLLHDYSIADIATFPWVNALVDHYEATDALGLANYENVNGWLARCNARPAAERGKAVNAP
jgi:GST-like protein